jgi:dTDP-4-dehydrorhamnose reductase
LYSKFRKNFVKKVIYKLLYTDETLNIVDDQIGQLTNVDDVSTLTFNLVQDMASGIFHVSSSGSASWFEVAKKIALLVGVRLDRIQPISSSAYNARAKRPSYSVLCHKKITNLGLDRIDDWEMCLEKSIQEISYELRHEVEAGKW